MGMHNREVIKEHGARAATAVVFDGEGRTKQSMKDECDINRIVSQFERTGIVTHLAKGQPAYLDISEVADYRTAIEQVRAASDFFMQLPAAVRKEFNNDPAELIDAMADPSEHGRLEELGLLEVAAAEAAEPEAAPVAPEVDQGGPTPPAEPPAGPPAAS